MRTEARESHCPKSYTAYGRIMNFYNSAGIFPLRWDFEHSIITVTKRHPIPLAIKSFLVLFQILFLDCQCIRVWMTNAHLLEKLYFSLQAGVYTATVANFAIMVAHPTLLAMLINNMLGVQMRYSGKLNAPNNATASFLSK